MAGAVSAGAYTAGVLDFLMEALEELQKAKDVFRIHLSSPSAGLPVFTNPVPLHEVSIKAFSGASAGGMCAAIASVMVQGSFDHITDPNATNTKNTFYEAWVNQIDISKLLKRRATALHRAPSVTMRGQRIPFYPCRLSEGTCNPRPGFLPSSRTAGCNTSPKRPDTYIPGVRISWLRWLPWAPPFAVLKTVSVAVSFAKKRLPFKGRSAKSVMRSSWGSDLSDPVSPNVRNIVKVSTYSAATLNCVVRRFLPSLRSRGRAKLADRRQAATHAEILSDEAPAPCGH
jgi:hypothetical protein